MTSFENQRNVENPEQQSILNEFKNQFGNYKGYDKFQNIFDTLESQKKDEFLKIFENNKDNPNLKEYYDPEIGESLPSNIKGINKFIKKFGNRDVNDIKEILEETKKVELGEKEVKLNKLGKNCIDIAEKIQNEPLYNEFFTNIKIDKDEYEIWLKNNENGSINLFIIEKNYKKFLEKAKEYDKSKGVSIYDEDSSYYKIYHSLKGLQNSGLKIKSIDFDYERILAENRNNNSIGPRKSNLAKLSIDTSEYYRTEIHGNIITYGDQVVDLGTNKKYIKSERGYLLESSDLGFKEGREYQEKIDKKYDEIGKVDKQLTLNNKNIDDLKNIKELSKKDLLNPELFRKVNKDIQKKIEDYDNDPTNEKLKQELINDIEEFVENFIKKIEEKNKELNKQKEDLIKDLNKLNDDYKEQENKFKEKIKNKDKKQRETIKFINRIGLDVIPQELLNNIINMLKNNMLNIPGLDINKQSINLENQQFGNSETVEDETLWKKNLVKFMNKLIYGDVNPKNTMIKESLIDPMNKEIIRPITITQELEKKGLYSSNGFHINKMIENLRKQPTKDKKEEENKSGKKDNFLEKPNPEAKPENPKKQ